MMSDLEYFVSGRTLWAKRGDLCGPITLPPFTLAWPISAIPINAVRLMSAEEWGAASMTLAEALAADLVRDKQIAAWLLAEAEWERHAQVEVADKWKARAGKAEADLAALRTDRDLAWRHIGDVNEVLDAAGVAEDSVEAGVQVLADRAEASSGLPAPDSANPAHLRFAADGAEKWLRSRPDSPGNQRNVVVEALRAEADRLEREAAEQEQASKVVDVARAAFKEASGIDTSKVDGWIETIADRLHAAGLLRESGE